MGGVCGIGSIKGRLSPIGSLQGALSIPVGGGLDCVGRWTYHLYGCGLRLINSNTGQ